MDSRLVSPTRATVRRQRRGGATRPRRRRPGSDPDPAYIGGAGCVPPLRPRLERLHLCHAFLGPHPRHLSPDRRGVGAGGLVEERLPPVLPLPAGVAELQRPVPPLGPAPPTVQPRDVPRHAAVIVAVAVAAGGAARRAAGAALGPAQRSGARHRRHGDAVPGHRRERVGAVAEHAEREPALRGGDSGLRELRAECGLGVEVVIARVGEAREHGEAGQRDVGGRAAAESEAVVEAAEAGALRDDVVVVAGVEGVGGEVERRGPEAVDAGAEDPGVGEVASELAVADEVQAPLHQTEVLQQALDAVGRVVRGQHLRARRRLLHGLRPEHAHGGERRPGRRGAREERELVRVSVQRAVQEHVDGVASGERAASQDVARDGGARELEPPRAAHQAHRHPGSRWRGRGRRRAGAARRGATRGEEEREAERGREGERGGEEEEERREHRGQAAPRRRGEVVGRDHHAGLHLHGRRRPRYAKLKRSCCSWCRGGDEDGRSRRRL
uniref:Uncharacterized protein n=1 Tax=Arundo donax TaxID=35708 RepID=A0A0A9CAA8_ARUDO